MTTSSGECTPLRRRAAARVAVVATSGRGASAAPSSAESAAGSSVAVPADVAGCESFAADGDAVDEGEGPPVLRLPCLVDGRDVSLDDLGDRPVLVNLWASWCAPCRMELPRLDRQIGEMSADRLDELVAADAASPTP